MGKLVLSCVTYALICSASLNGAWRLSGPFGGSARSLAIDPQNRNTLLAGGRDSLLFRSDDAGASWRLLAFPSTTPGTIDALIIDPNASGHFYAGLDAGDSQDSGVYESKDGGQSWQTIAGLRGLRIESLSISPTDAQVMAAGSSKGVYLTGDGGENWRRASKEDNSEKQDITTLSFDPTKSTTIYAWS